MYYVCHKCRGLTEVPTLKPNTLLYSAYKSSGEMCAFDVIKVNKRSYHFHWSDPIDARMCRDDDEFNFNDATIYTGGIIANIGITVFFTIEDARNNPQ